MRDELREILDEQYRDDIGWQRSSEDDVARARKAGDTATVLQQSLHLRLPDTCWALERWDEARRWYRHNAAVLAEQRSFYADDPTYPHDAGIDWEAETLVKAGDLEAGGRFLERALRLMEKDETAGIVRSRLALHAAQARRTDLLDPLGDIVEAREWFAEGTSSTAGRARELLHYEFAQAALMTSRWQEFEDRVEELVEGRSLVGSRRSGSAYETPLESALVAAGEGLEILRDLRSGAGAASDLASRARARFEEAMLHFLDVLGATDHHTYFMRLNCRLVDDLAAGREMEVNPFAPWSVEAEGIERGG